MYTLNPSSVGFQSQSGAAACRSTDFQSQMRMFRDRMLSMEVIQSPYGTAFQCRDLKSGFTFTIKPCINCAPPIRVPGHGGMQEVAGALAKPAVVNAKCGMCDRTGGSMRALSSRMKSTI